MLTLNQISHSFRRQPVLNKVQLSLFKSQVFGLIGVNGAGKSTLLKIAAGLIKPDKGSVFYHGQPISEITQYKNWLGFVGDEPNFIANLTVRENCYYAAKFRQLNPVQPTIDSLIEEMDLNNLQNQLAGKLSKGFQRRLSMVLALLHSPHILILDEPSDGFDQATQQLFVKLLQARKDAMITLIASHQLHDLQNVCTHIGILRAGKLSSEAIVDAVTKYHARFATSTSIDNLKLDRQKFNVHLVDSKTIEISTTDGKNLSASDLMEQLQHTQLELVEFRKIDKITECFYKSLIREHHD